MNAIRLSESPKWKKVAGKGKEVVDLLSDDDEAEDTEVGGKGNDGNQDTGPSKAVASSSSPNSDIVIVNDDNENQNDPPISSRPSSKGAIPLPTTSTSHKPTSASTSATVPPPKPKKRLDLTSGALAFPILPVPTNFTRLRAITEHNHPVSRRQVPYVELEKWTDEQKALYTVLPDSECGGSESGQPEPDNLTSFLGPDMAEIPPIPMSMPTMYEVIDSDEDIVPIPPPRRRALLSVEIPARRSQSSQNSRSGPSSSRPRKVDRDDEEVRAKKKGKGKQIAELDTDSEVEPSRPITSSKKGKGKARKETSEEDSDDDRPQRISKKDKGKCRARVHDESEDESDSNRNGRSRKNGKSTSHHSDHHRTKKPKRKEREPSLTQRELLDELALDESTRFKTATRLRHKKETPHARLLRKLKDKRNGIVRDTTSEDEDEGSEDESSDSARDSRGLRRSESFIASDDGPDVQVELPHEFSSNYAQTPEFKFKVVFQYFTLLAVCGTDILPLNGGQRKYFEPQLKDLRRRMEGHRDGRVRSQIWPSNYVRALMSYPGVKVRPLPISFMRDG
jgi:hypothetical protein